MKVKSQGQGQRVNVFDEVVNIRGPTCRVQQSAITLRFGSKNARYQYSVEPIKGPVIVYGWGDRFQKWWGASKFFEG